MTDSKPLVTVTGASGFIALHCVRELLARGHRVRGTLRSRSKEAAVRAALDLDEDAAACLEIVEANLLEDAGWDAAMQGATYVLHVASPLPAAPPKHEEDLIRPAREGTLRVLEAASRAGVSRVVLTSSTAAVSSGLERTPGRVFDESDWADLSKPIGAYPKSKTIAERAAWDFVRALPADRSLELVVMNPVYVLGPSLLGVDNASNEVLGKLLRREVPGVPRLHLPIVDVRDVALAHLAGMTVPEAAGKRFILVTDTCWYEQIAHTLKDGGYRVPTRRLPNWLVRVVAIFDKSVRLILGNLGQPVALSNAQARTVLGWEGRPVSETVLDTAEHIVSRQS